VSNWRNWLYVAFAAFLAATCFFRPVSGDFDRYVYEALVRGRYERVERIYPIVKHASPRAEASSVLDSAEHLAGLEPLYAIRPIYTEIITAFSLVLPIQKSINLVSALSLFGIALMLIAWARAMPLYCALLISTGGIVDAGRMGTPDALSALFVIVGFWLLERDQISHAILILLASIWVRTDNVLVVLALLVWLTLTKRIRLLYAILLATISAATVGFINQMAGNYGWLVLFRYSFIAGKYPAEIASHLTAQEYFVVATRGAMFLIPQLAFWVLLGLAAWARRPEERARLLTVALAAGAHFLLFPSPEGRYFVWAYLIVGIAFIQAAARVSRPSKHLETLYRRNIPSPVEAAS